MADDGRTAVGHGGGHIIGTGGVELRVPEDAVMQGVAAILKVAAISADQLPEGALPDVPGATVSSALKIDVAPQDEPPQFQKEVDLVFPKPADAPDGAVYAVLEEHRHCQRHVPGGRPRGAAVTGAALGVDAGRQRRPQGE